LEDAQAGEVLKFLLDTNIISELRKPRPHGGVSAWIQSHPNEAFAVPAIALFELQMGIELLRRQDPDRAQEFDGWIGRIAAATRVLPLDADAAREAARLLEKHSPELMADAMIAAIARSNGLTVATRNTRDFERFAVPLVNPFLHPR
jgi:predicted nucleic acid-binding protein